MLRKRSDYRLAARGVPPICDAMDLLGELSRIDAVDEERKRWSESSDVSEPYW
jgi:hypothetical protein